MKRNLLVLIYRCLVPLQVHELLMARCHNVPLASVHAELHVFGRLFRIIFSEADYTQSVFHVVNLGAYMIQRAMDLGVVLNALSTQSGEAQHKDHRDIMLRATQHTHTHLTLETMDCRKSQASRSL